MAVSSSGLHVNNDFLLFAIPGREIIFVQRMLARGERAFDRWGECVFL